MKGLIKFNVVLEIIFVAYLIFSFYLTDFQSFAFGYILYALMLLVTAFLLKDQKQKELLKYSIYLKTILYGLVILLSCLIDLTVLEIVLSLIVCLFGVGVNVYLYKTYVDSTMLTINNISFFSLLFSAIGVNYTIYYFSLSDYIALGVLSLILSLLLISNVIYKSRYILTKNNCIYMSSVLIVFIIFNICFMKDYDTSNSAFLAIVALLPIVLNAPTTIAMANTGFYDNSRGLPDGDIIDAEIKEL